jgi:hypothetical protein
MFEHLSTSELLERWKQELKAAGLALDPDFDRHPPAEVAAVQEAETRIGRPLPPSYREFLSVSDGWPACAAFVSALRTAATVGWFRDLESEWYDIWRDGSPEDDPGFDVELMGRALVVSAPGEQALLLDPDDVDAATGEWACYTFSNWFPGSNEVGSSFRAGLEHLYLDFVSFNDVGTDTEAESADVVDQAYTALLAGDLTARALLEPVFSMNWRAVALAVQFDVFGVAEYASDASTSVPNLWWGDLRASSEQEALTDQVVLNELLPMWLVRLHELRYDSNWEPQRFPEALTTQVHQLVQQINEGTGPIADFSYCSEFNDAVVRARIQIAAGELEDAWQTVLTALPLWIPMSDNHLAPVGLYYDKDLRRLLTPPPPRSTFPAAAESQSGPPSGGVWIRDSSTQPSSFLGPPPIPRRKVHSERTIAVLTTPYRRG